MNIIPRSHKSNISRLTLLAIFLLIVASRLPLIGGGFGSDNDSWRNAAGAMHMREAGRYIATRVPGFPVFEGLLVLLVPHGWKATNLLTAFAGSIAAICFLMIARRLRIRGALWITVAFAFSSILWVHTTQTMDYAVGLAFLLGAYLALLDRRYLVGGLLLALAAGTRVTLGALAAPALVMLLVRRDSIRDIVTFSVSFAVGIIVVFIPVLITIKPHQFSGEASYHLSRAHITLDALPGILRSSAVFLFGRIGTITVALFFAWKILTAVHRRISGTSVSRASDERLGINAENGPGLVKNRASLCFEAGTILIVSILFLMIPYELAYLIPLFPFVLLLVGRLLPRYLLIILAVFIVSETFAMPLFDQRRVVPGHLFQEIERRRFDLDETRALAELRPSEPTIFIIGRFAVHRLLILDPSLERTDAAWASFYDSGVALWSPDSLYGYAAELDQSDRTELMTRGYRISDHLQ